MLCSAAFRPVGLAERPWFFVVFVAMRGHRARRSASPNRGRGLGARPDGLELTGASVRLDVGDGREGEAPFGRSAHELGPAHHGSVVAHDLAA